MKKKIIYVDFVFKHKKVSYLKYYILNVFSSIIKKVTLITTSKNNTPSANEKRKMFK